MEHERERPESPLPKFPDYPVNERQDAAQAATARRLEREEAFVRTTDVAGHDFKHEHQERERER